MSQEYDLRQPSPWYNLATAALGLAALFAAAQAFAQDETANPNVIVDYGVLDELTDETTSASGETLPAPASKPVSRMLMSSDGSPITISDSSESMDETVSSVPTTPIESTNLTGDGTDAVETALDDSDLAAAAGDATDATDAEATDEAVAAAAETAMATALIEGQVRIAFEPGSDAIPETALGEINGLIGKMSDDPFMRVQVLAYAAGDDETTSVARRISLGRAMEVRRYLSEQGIDFDRMDVRALGNTALEEPIDRVDIIPLPQ